MEKNGLQEVLWHALGEWKRAHGCEKIARVGRGMKEGAVLKKLFRKNPNREYGKKEWRQSVEARSAEPAAC